MDGRPTIYNGIAMRSRLEAGFAAWCDQKQLKWEYEPLAYASQDGQYLPDFRLAEMPCSWTDEPGPVLVEVKPESFWSRPLDDRLAVCRRMCVVAESEPRTVLAIASPPAEHDRWDPHLAVVVADEQGRFSFLAPAVWTVSATSGIGMAMIAKGPWPDKYWTVD